MNSTIRLYDTDAYRTTFTATVLACEQKNAKQYSLILDQTLFFPEGGGQSPDRGSIEQANVLDVQLHDGIISHLVDQPFPKDMTVSATIDWKHRFSNMQQHSGEHIFSGLTYRHFGYDNVGFHLSDQTVTMDFNGILSEEDIRKLEEEANEVIAKNIPSNIKLYQKEELHTLEYRSKLTPKQDLRIVTFPGYDCCACCAPHVKYTGEIGLLKIIDYRKYKGGTRLWLLCGMRALADYQKNQMILSQLSSLLSVPAMELPANTQKLKEDVRKKQQEIFTLKKEWLLQKISKLAPHLSHPLLFVTDIDTCVLREAVEILTKYHDGYCGIFCAKNESAYQYTIGSATLDCTLFLAEYQKRFLGKGGGSPKMIQGSVTATKEELEQFWKTL